MKIVRDENQHNDFEKNFVVVHCWRKKFNIQRLILICFELRTLFDLKIKNDKTLYLYSKEKQKIKSRKLNIFIFFEESIVNENLFLNTCNRIHNCQNDDFETIKKKRTLFRKRKFDVLIKSI
jgi:hypothetical protein